MYGKPFNHARDVGTVHGDGRFAFEQDGQLYNAQKQPVDQNGQVMPLQPRAAAPEPTSDPEPTAPPPADNPDDDIPADEKPFDILAWAQGDEMLKATPFQKVKAEAAMLLGDATALTSKDAVRKAILAYYGLAS